MSNSKFQEFKNINRIWAIGSIHSDLDSFRSIKKYILSNFVKGDKLIFLGNVIGFRDTSKETASTYSQIGGLSNSVIKLAKGQSENQNRVAVITTRSSDQLVEKGVSWYSV